MKLIIAGTRSLELTHSEFNNILQTVFKKIKKYPTMILEGGSGKIDNAAAYWANTNINFLQHKQYSADWNKYNRAAGPIRNQIMVNEADALLLIWDGESPGSLDILKKATKKGLHIMEVIITHGNNKRTVVWKI